MKKKVCNRSCGMISDPSFTLKLLMKLNEERDELSRLRLELKRQSPLVSFAMAVSESKTTITVGDLSRIINQNGVRISTRSLYKWLRDNNYLIGKRGGEYNMPTQRAMDMGLLRVREVLKLNKDGIREFRLMVMVTGKGQLYFTNKFLSLDVI